MTLEMVSDRAKKRERERLSRQCRVAKIEQMRRMVDHLKRFLVVARTVKDDDGVWELLFDAKTRHIRYRLRKIVQLIEEMHTLQWQRSQLQDLLTERQFSTAMITNVLSNRLEDNWKGTAESHRELVRQHFQPWTIEACHEEKDVAPKEINVFEWSPDKQFTNLHFHGWGNKQRFDRSRGTFQFEFLKDFHGHDIMDCVNAARDLSPHSQTYLDVIVKNRPMSSFEVLQQLGPNFVIVRLHNRRVGMLGDIHDVLLVVSYPNGYWVLTMCPIDQLSRTEVSLESSK